MCSQFFKINYLQEYLSRTLEEEMERTSYERSHIIYFM